jgi:hypothetical protein
VTATRVAFSFSAGGCGPPDVLAELRRSGLLGGPSENYQLPLMRRNDRPGARGASAESVAS